MIFKAVMNIQTVLLFTTSNLPLSQSTTGKPKTRKREEPLRRRMDKSMVAYELWRPPLKKKKKTTRQNRQIFFSVERCLSDCCVSLTAGVGKNSYPHLYFSTAGLKSLRWAVEEADGYSISGSSQCVYN